MDIKVQSRKAFFDLARRSIGLLMESKIIADIRGGNGPRAPQNKSTS